MDFSITDEQRMLQDLVANFVHDELLPMEATVIKREVAGQSGYLTPEEKAKIDTRAKELGLFGLDAPEELGGANLSQLALTAVNEELGYSAIWYHFAPDSPNARLLLEVGTEAQRERYLEPLIRGDVSTAIGISEPGAGGDPSGMRTRATRDGNQWVLNGQKIWITNAKDADFIIAFALTDKDQDKKGSVTAFIVDKDAPGLKIAQPTPMLAGFRTYEVVFDDCRLGAGQLLGEIGQGWAPMQMRLQTRRIEIAGWAIGAARRALDMLVDYAPQRSTFGGPLSERQAVQFWVADARTKIHAARLMCQHAAWKFDKGEDARSEISMLKAYAVEMAWDVLDKSMQAHGALGMSKETPLYLLAEHMRLARVYEGPTEVHKWRLAKNVFAGRF